jgi:hypothetical protein
MSALTAASLKIEHVWVPLHWALRIWGSATAIHQPLASFGSHGFSTLLTLSTAASPK